MLRVTRVYPCTTQYASNSGTPDASGVVTGHVGPHQCRNTDDSNVRNCGLHGTCADGYG